MRQKLRAIASSIGDDIAQAGCLAIPLLLVILVVVGAHTLISGGCR